MATTTILSEIQDIMFAYMNDQSEDNIYNLNWRDVAKINDVSRRFCEWNFSSLLTLWEFYRCNDVHFLRDRQYFEFKDNIKTTKDITVWDTTIDITTDDLTKAWYIYSQWVVIQYTWKSDTQLTWCTWVVASFSAWTEFKQIEKINVNIDKSYRMFKMSDSSTIDVIEIPQWDDRFNRKYYKSFTIIYDELTQDSFMLIRWFNTWDRFMFKYYKQYVDLIDSEEEADTASIIPDEYAKTVIPAIAAWELLLEAEADTVERQSKLRLWYARLDEAYIKLNKLNKDPKKMMEFSNPNPISWIWNSYTSWTTTHWFKIF